LEPAKVSDVLEAVFKTVRVSNVIKPTHDLGPVQTCLVTVVLVDLVEALSWCQIQDVQVCVRTPLHHEVFHIGRLCAHVRHESLASHLAISKFLSKTLLCILGTDSAFVDFSSLCHQYALIVVYLHIGLLRLSFFDVACHTESIYVVRVLIDVDELHVDSRPLVDHDTGDIGVDGFVK